MKLPLPLLQSILRATTLIATLLIAASASALEVGELTTSSTLGEPLKAQLTISQHEDFGPEELLINQASPETYTQMGVDRSALYQELRFKVDENGLLTIYTRQPVKEPYLNFILQFRWADGELYREFKILLDPAKP